MSATQDEKRCAKRVYDGTFRGHQCAKRAVRDGFCAIHHPDAEKARRDKSSAQWQAAWEEKTRAENERNKQIKVGRHVIASYCRRTGVNADSVSAEEVIAALFVEAQG